MTGRGPPEPRCEHRAGCHGAGQAFHMQSSERGGGRGEAWEPTQPSCTLGQEAWLPDNWTGPAPRRAGTDPGAPVRSQYPTTH